MEANGDGNTGQVITQIADADKSQIFFLTSIINSSEDAIICKTPDGVIASWNPAAERMFGYQAEEVIGKPLSVLESPDKQGEMSELLEKVRKGEGVDHYETHRSRKDGSVIHISLTISLIHSPEGQLVGIASIARDMTERNRIVADYRRIFETTGDGILILDAQTGEILDVNPFLVWLLDYSRDDLLGKKLWDIGVWSDVAASKASFAELQQKEYLRYENYPLVAKGGRRIFVEFISNVYLAGGAKLIQCNIRDMTSHKASEESMVVSESRYRRLFEAAQDGILILNADTGEITDVNPFLVDMLGYSREEFVGKRLWEIGSFKDKEASKRAYQELSSKSYIRYDDLPLEARDGRQCAVEFVSNVYLVGQEKVIQCNIRDITARKKLEQEREQILLKLEAVLDNINDGVVIAGLDGTVLAMNKEALALHGFKSSRQFLKYQEIFEQIDNEGRPVPIDDGPLERALRGERFVDHEMRLRHKDSGKVWIASYSGTVVHNKLGEAILAVITLRDITGRKLVEEDLRVAQEQLQMITDTMPVGVVRCSRDYRYLWGSSAFVNWLQRIPEGIIGHSIKEVLGDMAYETLSPYFERALAGQKVEYETRVNFKGLGLRWITVKDTPTYDTSGQPDGWVSVIMDITHRKELEAQIKALNADLTARVCELEEANQELDAFNRMASHDLRQPLNTIGTSCQALELLCGDKLDDECKKYVHTAYDRVLAMNGLIEALLRFSRMAHTEPRLEKIDLSEMSSNVCLELKLADPERRVTFTAPESLTAIGDPNLVYSVLQNLIGNAWKYTGKKEDAVIELGATEIAGERVYFVRDNGIGFAPADMGRLFNPFERLPGSEAFEGNGIGLATVDRIIRRHKGRIRAEGEPGKGATFYFTLPVNGVSREA
jgi:PAS domain S-box-containing protein